MAKTAYRREAAVLAKHRMYNPHAMHHATSDAIPKLHRHPNRAVASPPPKFAALFCTVPKECAARSRIARALQRHAAAQKARFPSRARAGRFAGAEGDGSDDEGGDGSGVGRDGGSDGGGGCSDDEERSSSDEGGDSSDDDEEEEKGSDDEEEGYDDDDEEEEEEGSDDEEEGFDEEEDLRSLRRTFFIDASASQPQSRAGEPRVADFVRGAPEHLSRSKTELHVLRRLTLENVMTFTAEEAANPFYFFEQAWRCYFCGRQNFVIYERCSCRAGQLRHDDILPSMHLDLLLHNGGCSKESRALNELVRMCTLALPSGTHR